MREATVMKAHKPARTITHAKLTPEECREIAREEKIFICFFARQSQGPNTPGDWVVADPLKPVSYGQEVNWQTVGRCNDLRLDLPHDVFEGLSVNGNTATAFVKMAAPPGVHFYEAYVDGQLAIGGSSPGVIIDPHR
ncbi:MAG TPA: hypothetical protein VGU90_01595 [Terriglobales bacterium]|nr:hypothetical protein [Terriglobales bacterium]